MVREQVPDLGSIVARKLGRVAYAIYARPELAAGRRSLPALGGLPWIGFDDDHTYMPGQRWLQERLAGGKPVVRGNNWLVLHEAARAGAGFAILPCYLGDPDGELQRIGAPISEVLDA